MKITENQILILENLARYKFLTASQILEITDIKNIQTVWRATAHLRDLKLINTHNYPIIPKRGRIESLNNLTKKGVDFLIDEIQLEENQIKYPIARGSLIFRDYDHRVSTIYFNIKLNILTKKEQGHVDFFNYYFDKAGGNRGNTAERLRAKTKINIDGGYLIADAITQFNYQESDYLYVFEQHNGKDSKRALEGIIQYAQALSEGTISKQYNFNKSARIVWVIEKPSVLKSLSERIKLKPQLNDFKKFFIFKLDDDLKNTDLLDNWRFWDGTPANFTK
jgi:hypothetical protein